MELIIEHSEEDACINNMPLIGMMNPKDILPSLFGADVNPIASEEEDLALRESISRNGVQVPITAGRIKGKGKPHVVKGTRRHKIALALGLPEILTELKEYDSLEEMRQDAIEDNLERRQLSMPARARLAYALWLSYDSAVDKKEMSARGLTPRKRAAIAGGLSEGSLAAYRGVQDSGNAELIAEMEAGKISISAAHARMNKELNDSISEGEKKDFAKRIRNHLVALDALIAVGKQLPGFIAMAKDVRKDLETASKSDRLRITKKIAIAAKIVTELQKKNYLVELDGALSNKERTDNTLDESAFETLRNSAS